jgi:transposase-like protein
MPHAPDPALRAAWQRRMRAFDAFAGTVQEFCEQQDVSTAAFYQWRRKLACQVPSAQAGRKAPPAESPPQFVALRLVHDEHEGARQGALVIQLPGGARIEMTGQDPRLVQAVLAQVLEQDASQSALHRAPATGKGAAP